jgi:hypothetical protein
MGSWDILSLERRSQSVDDSRIDELVWSQTLQDLRCRLGLQVRGSIVPDRIVQLSWSHDYDGHPSGSQAPRPAAI